MKFFVAKALKGSLDNVVLSSQEVDSLNILEERVYRRFGHTEDPQEMRQRMHYFAKKVSFTEYIETFLLEYLVAKKDMEHLSLESLNRTSSLYPLSEFLKKSKHISMIHNADDFLLRGGDDVDYLEQLLGNRLHMFPRGGHLGNYWHQDSLEIYTNNISRRPTSDDEKVSSGTMSYDFIYSF